MRSVQEVLKEACDESGEDVTFNNDYSGRGMYGACCVGITGTAITCRQVIAYAIKELSYSLSRVAKESVDPDYSATDDDLADTENGFDSAITELMSFNQDSMGFDVILYWPNLKPLLPCPELEEECIPD